MIPFTQAELADNLQLLYKLSREDAVRDAGRIIYKLSQSGIHLEDSVVKVAEGFK